LCIASLQDVPHPAIKPSSNFAHFIGKLWFDPPDKLALKKRRTALIQTKFLGSGFVLTNLPYPVRYQSNQGRHAAILHPTISCHVRTFYSWIWLCQSEPNRERNKQRSR
jgi:hypothetical protein